jgi:RimJ/RimL family protein N-acetyltransferase
MSRGHRYRSEMSRLTGHPNICSDRLLLDPLRLDDAEELVEVLADPALHEFTGGTPAALDDLRARFESWARGSGSDTELWLNWIVRRREDSVAIGTLQATIVIGPDSQSEALLAWTIGTAWQRQGYATEATCALVQWLTQRGVGSIIAHIHPEHIASSNVATSAGLRPTTDVVDGETVWRFDRGPDQSV